MSEWQPIETAPKDGTRILAWVPPYGPSTAHYNDGQWRCHSVLNKDAVPTLWQPIMPPEGS